jgi:NTE family protein
VTWRQKQIQYASRTTYHIDSSARQHELRHSLNRLSRNLPADAPRPATARRVMERGNEPMYFFHIIYEPGADQVPLSDAEFSRASIAARRAAGYSDMRNLMEQSPWSRHPALVGEPAGASVYEVRGGRISSRDPLARPAPHGVPRNGQAINPTLTPMDIPESA